MEQYDAKILYSSEIKNAYTVITISNSYNQKQYLKFLNVIAIFIQQILTRASMGIQINTKIGTHNSNNAKANLNAQMKNIQVKLSTHESPNNISEKSSSLDISKTLDSKVKQMDIEKENLFLTKNKLATLASQLKSIQIELKQISPEINRGSSSSKELSEIAMTIRVIASEIDTNFRINNSSNDYDTLETELANALGTISKLEQKLISKDMLLTSAIANSQASLSRLIFTKNAINQLNNIIKD
jgi:hypothetical protein